MAFLYFSLILIALCVGLPSSVDSAERHVQDVRDSSQSSIEFSARMVWRKDGKISKAQLFVKGDRYRLEHWSGIKTDLGVAGVTIVRLDLHKVWYVYSKRRLVLSVPSGLNDVLPVSVILDGEVGRTLIGDAQVGSQPAQLYEVEVLSSSGQREKYYEWVDPERQVLLKLVSQDRDWRIEFRHVVLSTQPDYYFQPPLGYRKIEAQNKLSETG